MVQHVWLLVKGYQNKMATQTSSVTCTNLVDPKEACDFIKRCIEGCGSSSEHAACLADVLVEADLRGHYSHGMNRLEMYARELLNKQCDGTVTPVIVKETCATAYVDAKNGIGTVGMEWSFCLVVLFPVCFRWLGSFAWN